MSRKKYGPHAYVARKDGLKCKFGCGCWKQGSGKSGIAGPEDIDPNGDCPKNPTRKKKKRSN